MHAIPLTLDTSQAILTPRHLGLVMEVADGGSLTSSVADQASHSTPGKLVMDEEEARYFFTQFVEAMAFCHAHGIAHRCAQATAEEAAKGRG